jgi:hypothetical protein
MTNGLEPAHSPFSFSDPFMRTFSPIVHILSRVMERVGHQVAMGRAIAQAESVVQPHSVADDFFWKAAAMIE